jgi:hypothetical protein
MSFFLAISPLLDFFLTFPFPIDSISVFQNLLFAPSVGCDPSPGCHKEETRSGSNEDHKGWDF